MEKVPLISVITVTYNAGKVITKTLESLKLQSFKNFEHIVIDGKSKDDTLQKIKEYYLPQSQVISEPDRGLYDAMNKGLKMAKGKYLIFLNAGDTFHDKDTLRKYAEVASGDKDIIYGDTIIVDNNGKKISDRHLSAPENLTFKSFLNGMLVCHQAFMVKKELAPQYDLKYHFSADYDWCVKCLKVSNPNKCVNLKSVTIDYLSDGLTDKNKFHSLMERMKIMGRHYGWPLTLTKHLVFIFRSLRRGKI